MVFRDDDEALRARVDALEGKLAATEAENARLRAATTKTSAPEVRPRDPQVAPVRGMPSSVGVVFVLVSTLAIGLTLLAAKAYGMGDDDVEVWGWMLVAPSSLFLLILVVARIRRPPRIS